MICSRCGTSNPNESERCRRCRTALHPSYMRGKIPCYLHANREAVTSCGVCGKRLCAACAVNARGIDYCEADAPADAIRPSFDFDYEKLPVLNPDKAVPATFLQRFRAFLIDLMLFITIGVLLGMVAWAFSGQFEWVYSPRKGQLAFYALWIPLLVASMVYASVSISMCGQTFGKQIIGLIVLRSNGHILDWRTSSLRAMTAFLSMVPFGLGYAWMFWDKEKLTWHDKLADTNVFQYEEIT